MADLKPTNPKDAIGIRKAGTHLIPKQPLYELGLAMLEGALKYGAYNWRTAGVRYSVYLDAAKRHIDAFSEGEDIDPDSGLPHLVKAMACFAILRDGMIAGNATDDRPPPMLDGWMKNLHEKAGALIDRYGKVSQDARVTPAESGIHDFKKLCGGMRDFGKPCAEVQCLDCPNQ